MHIILKSRYENKKMKPQFLSNGTCSKKWNVVMHWYDNFESCPQAAPEHCALLAINKLAALQADDGFRTAVLIIMFKVSVWRGDINWPYEIIKL